MITMTIINIENSILVNLFIDSFFDQDLLSLFVNAFGLQKGSD